MYISARAPSAAHAPLRELSAKLSFKLPGELSSSETKLGEAELCHDLAAFSWLGLMQRMKKGREASSSAMRGPSTGTAIEDGVLLERGLRRES